MKLETFYDRTNLINRTTETVRENVVVGMILVTLILFVFLERRAQQPDRGHQHSAGAAVRLRVLYFRGVSANLLSLGAVDFGIIVDSSVIMVESIYPPPQLSGVQSDLPLPEPHSERRRRSAAELVLFDADHGLRPVAAVHDDRAGRADFRADGRGLRLLAGRGAALALTISPVLCRMFMSKRAEATGQLAGPLAASAFI